MYSWQELADKFEELTEPLQHTFINVQWGDSGTHLFFQGVHSPAVKTKFETLSEVAGKKFNDLPDQSVNKENIISENSNKENWYRVLWKLGDSFQQGRVGHMMDGDEIVGNIYTGTIPEPVQDSINLCIRLSDYDKQKEEPGRFKRFWDKGGQELVIGILLIILGIIIEGIFDLSGLFKN